jgi:hypothetical protein
LLDYINAYPAGSFSRLATDRLNSLGDYTYRNHRLGFRTVTLAEIVFIPSSDKLSETAYPSLDLVGETVANMPNPTTQHAHNRLLPFFSSGVTSRNGDFGAESTPPVQ